MQEYAEDPKHTIIFDDRNEGKTSVSNVPNPNATLVTRMVKGDELSTELMLISPLAYSLLNKWTKIEWRFTPTVFAKTREAKLVFTSVANAWGAKFGHYTDGQDLSEQFNWVPGFSISTFHIILKYSVISHISATCLH